MSPVKVGLIIIALAVGARIALLGFYDNLIDDAYIFMRYADNFASGMGLVYNASERVLGYTSPLYVLLLSSLRTVLPGLDFTLAISVLNLGLFAAASICFALSLDERGFVAWCGFAFFCFYFPYMDSAVVGMETQLLLFLTMATVYSISIGRRDIGMVLAAFACLTRPEGLFVAVAALGHVLLVGRHRLPVRGIAVAVCLVSAWALFAWYYYGSPVPQSMLSKSALYAGPHRTITPSAPALSPATLHLLLSMGFSSISFLSLAKGKMFPLLVAGSAALTAGFLLAAHDQLRRKSALAILPATYVLILLFYVVGKSISVSSWHTILPSVCFMTSAYFGLASVARRLGGPWARGLVLAAFASLILVAGHVGMRSRDWSVNTVQGDYRELARTINGHFPDARTMLIGHIGIVGYLTRLEVIDANALVSRDLVGGKYAGDVILSHEPDLIVGHLFEKDRWGEAFRDARQEEYTISNYTRIDGEGLPPAYARKRHEEESAR